MTEEPDRQPIWPDALRVVASLAVAVGVNVAVPKLWPYHTLVGLAVVIGFLLAAPPNKRLWTPPSRAKSRGCSRGAGAEPLQEGAPLWGAN
jgi:hypothetical protein